MSVKIGDKFKIFGREEEVGAVIGPKHYELTRDGCACSILGLEIPLDYISGVGKPTENDNLLLLNSEGTYFESWIGKEE